MRAANQDRSWAAWAAGILVVALWASAFPAIRIAAPDLGVVGLTWTRLVIASAGLVAVCFLTRARLPRPADLALVIACGLVGIAGYLLLLSWGELFIPAGTASLIVSAAPIVSVAFAAVTLKEKITPMTIVGSCVAIAGVAVVCLARAGVSLTSAVWTVVAAGILQGLYHPLTRPLLRRYSGLEVATYATIAGAIFSTILIPLAWSDLTNASPSAWGASVYLGLLPSALGFALWGFALSRLSVAKTTSLLYLVPIFAVGISFIWLGEAPLAVELLGGAIAVFGVVLLNTARFGRQRGTRRTQVDKHSPPASPAAVVAQPTRRRMSASNSKPASHDAGSLS